MKLDKNQSLPILGRVLADRTIIETIYDPGKEKGLLAIKHNEDLMVEDHYQDPISGITYRPLVDNNVRSRIILLPNEIGQSYSPDQIMNQLGSYIHKYVDLDGDELWITSAYAMMTHLYEVFEKVPYLRFTGCYGSGKSRALKTMKGVCYHPINLGTSQTAPNLFRMLDVYGHGTLFLDEANFTDSTRSNDMVKILIDGYSRDGVVSRCDPKTFQPKTFQVFSPKVLANHTVFDDPALESRMFTILMKPTQRKDIPICMPSLQEDGEIRSLRNALLRFRLDNYWNVDPQLVFGELAQFDGRAQEIAFPLIAAQLSQTVPSQIMSFLALSQEEQRQRYMYEEDAIIARNVVDCLEHDQKILSVKDFVQEISDREDILISNKKVSHHLRLLGGKLTRANHGMVVNLQTINPDFLKNRYGI